MKRLGQFLRSVIPADPWQLVFLAGAIFLFICPRLPWRPSRDMLMSDGFPLAVNSDAVINSLRLLSALLFPAAFAGIVAYYTCFYPGQKPIRRTLTLVFLPALVSLGSILFVLSQIFRPVGSIFQSQAFLPFVYRWIRANVPNLPAGLWFLLFSLLLMAIFLMRLRFGKSSLPLSLPDPVALSEETNDLWPRVQIVVFTLLAPLFFFSNFIGVFLSLPLLALHGSGLFFYTDLGRIAESVLRATLLVALPIWILGPSGKNTARRVIQLTEPRYALFAFLLPVFSSGLPQVCSFAIDRVQWATFAFSQTFAPQFGAYFDLSHLWDPWLLLMIFGAFAEEIVFRGLLLQNFIAHYGFRRGTFLTGIVWGAYHFRSDTYSGLSVGGVFLQLANRILICLVLNYVFAWMTLRWKSIIPAAVTHTVFNILVMAGINNSIPWDSELRILEWGVVAFLLFHYCPLAEFEPEPEGTISPMPPLESAV